MQHDFQHYAIQMELICHFDVFDVDTSSMGIAIMVTHSYSRLPLIKQPLLQWKSGLTRGTI